MKDNWYQVFALLFGMLCMGSVSTFKYFHKHRMMVRVALTFLKFASDLIKVDQTDARLPAAKRLSMWVHQIAYAETQTYIQVAPITPVEPGDA